MVDYDDWGDRPVPVLDPESEPYWAAAGDGELVVQRCADCDERQLYPRVLCRHCWSRDLSFEGVAGTGSVHSFTRCHTPGQPGYDEAVPYTVALVELDLPEPNPSGRSVRLTTHVDCPPDELEVGLAVTVGFERISTDPPVHLPVFYRA